MGKIICHGKSDTGLLRPHNEDVFALRPEVGFCLVADGMGGAAAGEVASAIFAAAVEEVFSFSSGSTHDWGKETIERAFQRANSEILAHVDGHPHHKGMGCTAEVMAFYEDRFVIGHIGDSRTYRFRNGHLKQLTKDHSLVQAQIDQGLIRAEEAREHSLRNIILRAVGVKEELSPDLLTGTFLYGDIYLLCSDGLSDMVEDCRIEEVLNSSSDLRDLTKRLINAAKASGGRDNITVVLVAYIED